MNKGIPYSQSCSEHCKCHCSMNKYSFIGQVIYSSALNFVIGSMILYWECKMRFTNLNLNILNVLFYPAYTMFVGQCTLAKKEQVILNRCYKKLHNIVIRISNIVTSIYPIYKIPSLYPANALSFPIKHAVNQPYVTYISNCINKISLFPDAQLVLFNTRISFLSIFNKKWKSCYIYLSHL